MQRLTPGALLDLLAATEAVRDDLDLRRGRAHGREQHALADRLRDLVLALLEPERARHAAAAGRDDLVIQPEPVEELALAIGADDGVLVTMQVHQRLLAMRARRLAAVRREEVTEEDALLGKPCR